MAHYNRSAWVDPKYPITGPAPKAPTTTAVCHWPGGNINPNTPAYLRSMQQSYVTTRGYSLGYWWYVEQNGDSWQIRGPGEGPTFNSAANKGDKVPGNANDWTAPILFGVNGQPLSDAAISTAKRLWATLGITTRPVPHSDLDNTTCCGDVVRNQINAGLLDPGPTTPGEPHVSYTVNTIIKKRVADTICGPGVTVITVPQAAGHKAIRAMFTAVTPGGPGYAVAYLNPKPDTSTINYDVGLVDNATDETPVDANGAFNLFVHGTPVRVIVDLIAVMD